MNKDTIKILCLSDSHRQFSTIYNIALGEKPNIILHAGDSEGAFEKLEAALSEKIPGVECHAVLGNCDWFSNNYPHQKLINVRCKRFFIMHGHQYPALRRNNDYTETVSLAKKHGADVLIFGHTHTQMSQNMDGILVVNPGAAKIGAYAVIEVGADGAIEVHLLRERL